MERKDQREHGKEDNFHISDRAVKDVVTMLTGDPEIDLQLLNNSLLNNAPFADIFTSNFQILRIRNYGWRIPIDEDLKTQFGIQQDSIDSVGPEEGIDISDEDAKGAWDFFTGVGLVRGVIASTLIADAKINGTHPPTLHDDRIDIPAVPNEKLATARSSRNGVHMYDIDRIGEQMKVENPALHHALINQIATMAKFFTPRTKRLHQHLPTELLDLLEPQILERWHSELRSTAFETYVWFHPTPPQLLPVRVQDQELRSAA